MSAKSASAKLKLVLCWHMHQPEYRDLTTGEFILPWTYLHVIKDYVDMAAHLEACPNAKAVVNFAPILLEQIADYAKQIHAFLHEQKPIKDSLLAALASNAIPENPEIILTLIKACLRANRERQINRYPVYKRLADMADWLEQHFENLAYINAQYITDIVVWYHLAWIGETVKLNNDKIKHLIEKGHSYTEYDKRELLEIIGELHAHIIHRYQVLAKNGQVELSFTPYAHPIMPLLLDLNSAKEAMPYVEMPEQKTYPDGESRCVWHIEQGLNTFKRYFGFAPSGCWPSEGSICARTLHLLNKHQIRWTASGGAVLRHSLIASEQSLADYNDYNHHAYRLNNTDVTCFFRDDGLSDLIGFEYSKWHSDDAVNDFIHHLDVIAANNASEKIVAIIMDGENAWEHYPENGHRFLSQLYQRLSTHPNVELTTFSACLDAGIPIKPLSQLVSGSWVYGSFSTWIGDADKNRAWDMLHEAKTAFDHALAKRELSPEQRQQAEHQLAICEGSDWFWWFGDYNPGEVVSNFEKQFRLNLINLYQLIGKDPPAYLALSFTQGCGSPVMGGTMRPSIET